MSINSLLSLACFVISQGTILISYLIALQFDHPKVESCNPFFQGCLNITDAGIYSPEGYVFRGGMITACAFFIMWWVVSFKQFNDLYRSISERDVSRLNVSATFLGILGAICLIVATAVLIPPREAINWDVHVAGATLFFLISFSAQLVHCILCYSQKLKACFSSLSLRIKLISVVLQALMIITVLIKDVLPMGEEIANSLEWWLALLIAIYFLSGYWDWKKQDVSS